MLRTTVIRAAALVILATPGLRAQQVAPRVPRDSASAVQQDPERRARLGRRGGGLRIGTWDVGGLDTPSGASVSTTPAFEGFVRRGLDLHLAVEHSVAVWRRTQRVTQTTTTPLGGTTQSTSTLETYIVPQYTSIAFFPLTRPEHHVEPYVKAGAGFAVGVDDRSGSGNGLFSSPGMSLIPGYGATGGAGVEVRFTDALGLAAAGRYQWTRFFQELSGRRTFEGFGAELGMTYRFQFR